MIKYTLITGASKGIGLELARVYASQAQNLILVARSQDRLKQIAKDFTDQYGVRVHYYAGDLSKIETAKKLVQWTREKGYEVETLVNNAGFGSYGEFHKSDLKNEWEMLQLNIMTLMYLTRAYLPPMVFHNKGGILNVASIAAFMPGPRMANYYASKAYVLSFTQALAGELKDTKLKIGALCPGPVKTDFFTRAKFDSSKRLIKTDQASLTAKEVATYAYENYQRGQVVIIPGKLMKMLAFLARKKPLGLVAWFMSCFQ